jgi:hypothetical protein
MILFSLGNLLNRFGLLWRKLVGFAITVAGYDWKKITAFSKTRNESF